MRSERINARPPHPQFQSLLYPAVQLAKYFPAKGRRHKTTRTVILNIEIGGRGGSQIKPAMGDRISLAKYVPTTVASITELERISQVKREQSNRHQDQVPSLGCWSKGHFLQLFCNPRFLIVWGVLLIVGKSNFRLLTQGSIFEAF